MDNRIKASESSIKNDMQKKNDIYRIISVVNDRI